MLWLTWVSWCGSTDWTCLCIWLLRPASERQSFLHISQLMWWLCGLGAGPCSPLRTNRLWAAYWTWLFSKDSMPTLINLRHWLLSNTIFSIAPPYIYIYIYIYIYMEVNKEIKYDSMKKSRKTNNPKFDDFVMKVDVERFSYNNLLQDSKFMENVIEIAMDIWWNSMRKVSVYKKERFLTVYSAFLFLKILLLCWRLKWCLKCVGFLRDITEDDKNNDRIFLKKKWRKGRENEYEHIVHEDKFKV